MSEMQHSSDRAPDPAYAVLLSHLPHSLALLRRLQFMNMDGGRTDNSHILTLFESPDIFTVAYVDLSRGPETEIWLYSSMEALQGQEITAKCQAQVIGILERVKEIEQSFVAANGPRSTPGVVLIGTLHEMILSYLQTQERVQHATVPNFKFIFDAENVPSEKALPNPDLFYSQIRKSDIPLVLSRTAIPRKEYVASSTASGADCKQKNYDSSSQRRNHAEE